MTGSTSKCIALVVAAGRGSRFGTAKPKQYTMLAGASVLRHSVLAFRRHPAVSDVRVVIHPDDAADYERAVGDLGLLDPVPGGATRQESVLKGLASLQELAPDIVLIHDAARPLASLGVLDRVIAALENAPGAIPALPVVDTLKRAAGGTIVETVPRDNLWHAQTPQGFRYASILDAHQSLAGAEMTDDAAVAAAAGLPVTLVQGSEENIKITTDRDLHRCEHWLGGAWETRTALGYDVHRFCPGDHVMLCGVAVPHDRGLEGHSDADVALHAITDALLGTLAAGDIGSHFPPSDPQWRGAASHVFVRHAVELVARAGGSIVNVDVTLICERPRIGQHRPAMRQQIAEMLNISADRISVKATTTERLGFTGREEGIAAQAAAVVRLPAEAMS